MTPKIKDWLLVGISTASMLTLAWVVGYEIYWLISNHALTAMNYIVQPLEMAFLFIGLGLMFDMLRKSRRQR